MIQLANVSKRFGSRWAVDDLSLTVAGGQIYGLLGHNGAGKSTTIGMILGQVWPTSGQVTVCGYEVSNHRRLALEKVGAIFESPAFYDYLSGYRNLEILSSYTAPTRRARILEVVEWVGLAERAHSKVRTYSHGMRARLALAQALLPGPDLLILDEPGDGLDPEGMHELRHTILRLHREFGLTILLSSHLLHEVEQLCTRIAVLNQGRKVFEGTLEQACVGNGWVKLATQDFGTAAAALQTAGLIASARDGGRVKLAAGVGVEEIARFLVEHRYPLYELAREEPTLEDFYIGLMQRARKEGPTGVN